MPQFMITKSLRQVLFWLMTTIKISFLFSRQICTWPAMNFACVKHSSVRVKNPGNSVKQRSVTQGNSFKLSSVCLFGFWLVGFVFVLGFFLWGLGWNRRVLTSSVRCVLNHREGWFAVTTGYFPTRLLLFYALHTAAWYRLQRVTSDGRD